VVTGVSILVGIATEPAFGVGFFTAVALAALVWDLLSTDPDRRRPLLEAEHEPHAEAGTGRRRILVIANESLEGDRLRDEISGRGGGQPELIVLAPVLTSKTHFTVSDVDREMEEARRRLHATVQWARRQGFATRGDIGDWNAPFASIEDELRRYGADEVIVATHPLERRNWLEGGMLERLREELDIPVTHVVVDSERHAVEIKG
jgi:GABA permease